MTDKIAIDRIEELEVLLMISEEDCDALREENQVLRAQLQALKNCQEVDYQG